MVLAFNLQVQLFLTAFHKNIMSCHAKFVRRRRKGNEAAAFLHAIYCWKATLIIIS
jgi:hypothetical protein